MLLRTVYSINNFFRTLTQGLLFYGFAIITIDIYTQKFLTHILSSHGYVYIYYGPYIFSAFLFICIQNDDNTINTI